MKKITRRIRDVSKDSDLSKGLHHHKEGVVCLKCAKTRELSKEANKRYMNMVHLNADERKADKARVKEAALLSLSGKGSIDPDDRKK